MKAVVVINEQHTLLKEQEEILKSKYDSIELVKIPADGLTAGEQEKLAYEIHKQVGQGLLWPKNPPDVVFVSPVPYLLKRLVQMAMVGGMDCTVDERYKVLIFHNDNREKKELPGGKVVSVVSQTGWQLI